MKMKELLRRYAFMLPVFWLGNATIGLAVSILGASLPYVAARVSQNLATMGFVITARSIGFCIASFATGFIFCRLRKPHYKLCYLAAGVGIMGLGVLAIPFCRSFVLLVAVMSALGIGIGMYDTGVNNLMVYIFGPTYCAPVLQFLHFGVAMGAFLAPVLNRPFIEQMGPIRGQDAYCMKSQHNITQEEDVYEESSVILSNWPPMTWSFVIIASVNAFVTLGLLFFAIRKTDLHEITVDDIPQSAAKSCPLQKGDLRYRSVMMFLLFIFYIMICGKENMFWSHLFSFGICSKLNLSIAAASNLNTAFFVGFLSGRGSGIIVTRLLIPEVILIMSFVCCIITSTILSIWGEAHVIVAMVTVGAYGYVVSMIFGCGISWIAARTKVTGAVSSIWFIGAYVGISVYPLLAGVLFATPSGAIVLAYLAAASSILDAALFGLMTFLARFRVKAITTEDLLLEKL